jgi:hypothetical protein
MTETRGTKEFFRFFVCGQFIFHPILMMFFFYITNQILTDLPWLLPFSKYKEVKMGPTSKILNFNFMSDLNEFKLRTLCENE